MIKRLLLLVSVMGLAIASAASNFNLNFYQPTVVNGTTLKIGEAKSLGPNQFAIFNDRGGNSRRMGGGHEFRYGIFKFRFFRRGNFRVVCRQAAGEH